MRFARDASRTSLFTAYDRRSTSPSKAAGTPGRSPGRPASHHGGAGYGFAPAPADPFAPRAGLHAPPAAPAFGAYPGHSTAAAAEAGGGGSGAGSARASGEFRAATPNARGQYSDAVLDELESQNEGQVGMLSGKVRMLKDVRRLAGLRRSAPFFPPSPTHQPHKLGPASPDAEVKRPTDRVADPCCQLTVAIGDEIRDSTALAEKMNDSFDGTRVRLRGTMRRMLRMADRTGISWKAWLAFFAAVIVLFWYVWLF